VRAVVRYLSSEHSLIIIVSKIDTNYSITKDRFVPEVCKWDIFTRKSELNCIIMELFMCGQWFEIWPQNIHLLNKDKCCA
jgi:hypothetical protein